MKNLGFSYDYDCIHGLYSMCKLMTR